MGSSIPRAWLWAAAIALLLASGACRRGDVLLITVDALRPDHLGLYGYPRPTSRNLDRRLADAAVFLRAYSAAGQTAPSVPSLLSGRLPQEHGVRMIWQLLPDRSALIPDLLPPRYQTAAFVSNMVLTDEAMGLGGHFDHYDDFVDEKESARVVFERNARRTVDAAIRWLREGWDRSRPLFLWIHLIDPHGPYQTPPEWSPLFTRPSQEPAEPRPSEPGSPGGLARVAAYMRLPGVTDGLGYVDRYDDEIAFADHHLERLFRAYSDLADLDQALIVVSADHGESMMEHDRWFSHGHHVYEEVVRVPLIVRGPGVRPGPRDQPVSAIDVAPTILRFAGATVPEDLQGIDLRDSGSADPDRSIFFEASTARSQWRGELRGLRKWIVRLAKGSGEVEESWFFDLAQDPRELHPRPWSAAGGAPPHLLDLCGADPDPGGLPEQYLKGVRLSAPKVADRADARALEALRSLGYVD